MKEQSAAAFSGAFLGRSLGGKFGGKPGVGGWSGGIKAAGVYTQRKSNSKAI